MWIMTPYGFISVVAKGEGADTLTIRARDYESLEHFVAHASAGEPDFDRITEGGGTDYPFRVVSSRTEVQEYLMQVVDCLNYPNFKNEAKRVRGRGFAEFLGKVWSAGWDLTPRDVRDREDERYREWLREEANPHYATNGVDESWVLSGRCDCCGKKMRRCKCTDDELDEFYSGGSALVRVKDIADMTDKEFEDFERGIDTSKH